MDFSTISSLRWFHNIRPSYYNSDDFAVYIFRHLPHLENELDIYQKSVYKWNDKKERIVNLAIAIDGAFEVKYEALDFLHTHTNTHTQITGTIQECGLYPIQIK